MYSFILEIITNRDRKRKLHHGIQRRWRILSIYNVIFRTRKHEIIKNPPASFFKIKKDEFVGNNISPVRNREENYATICYYTKCKRL